MTDYKTNQPSFYLKFYLKFCYYSFFPDQLREIKKASLSRLICDSGASISKLQLNSFKVQCQRNPETPCENLLSVNLNLWRDQGSEKEDPN